MSVLFAAFSLLLGVVVAVTNPRLANAAPAKPGAAPTTAGDESLADHIDALHDGVVPNGIERPPFVQKWTRTLSGAVSYPLVTDGKVFVTLGASNGPELYAIDATTGKDVWGPLPLGGTYDWAAATAGGGDVYTLNESGLLLAFNMETGVQQWAVTLPGQYMFTSPPTFFNGIVYSGGAGTGGTVYATRASDGALLWTAPVENGDDSSPAVSADGVYVSYACPQAYDFDPVSGQLKWHYSGSCEGGGGSTPTVADGKVWIRDGINGPITLNAATGAVTGTFAAGPMPAFDGSNAFFLEGKVLQARNAATLSPLWSFTGDGNLVTAPIIDNGFLYVGSSSGTVWALNEATGAAVWSANAGSPIAGPTDYGVVVPTGLAAGQGLLVVPTTNSLVAYTPIGAPPTITSESGTTFPVGAPGSFKVTTSGYPAATVSEQGTLPSGVTFNSATGSLTGAPAQGSTGSYPITLTASNGLAPDAVQNFTLTVNQATMTFPTDGQSAIDTTQPFSWSTIPQAQGYIVAVGTKRFGTDLVNSGPLPASQSSLAVPALPAGPTLYATLLARIAGQWSSYQAVTFTAAPGEATFTYPLDGQTAVDPTRSLTWSTIPQAQGYLVVIGTSQFGTDVANSGVLPPTQSSFTPPVLPANKTLHATVLTKVNGVFSRYQAITFTTGPANATLTHPVNGQLRVVTPGSFTWAGLAGAQNYYLVVGTSLFGKDLVDSGILAPTQLSLAVPALPNNKLLYATLLTEIGGKWSYSVVGFTAA